MGKFGVWVPRIIGAVVVLVAAVAVWAAIWYLSDAVVEADVIDRRCNMAGSSQLTIETRWLGLERTRELNYFECQQIPSSAFVQYYIRSGRTVIFESEGGACVWDTGGLGPC